MLRTFLVLAALAVPPVFSQALTRLPPPPVDSARVDSLRVADSLRVQKAVADTSGDTVIYSAARIRFRTDRFSLADHALLKYKGSTLKADSIVYYSGDDIVEAFGAPVIEDASSPPIQGYRMRYSVKNRVGTVYYGSSTKETQSFNGIEVRREPDGDIYVARGDLSTCDLRPDPHYFFYARRMIIEPESKVLSGPIVMNIADVPVAVLPMMVLPLGKGRRSGILQPKFGGDQTQGYYFQNLGYFWAISDYQDLLGSADVVEGQRGTFDQTNFNLNYEWNKRYVWSGTLGGKLYVPQFNPSAAGGYVDFSNDLNLTPDGRQTLKGSGRIQSDPKVVDQNALTEEERLQQTANANLGYTRQFDWNQASLNASVSQDYNLTQNQVNRNLPDLAFHASGPLVPVSEDASPAAEDAWYRNWTWDYGNHFNLNQIRRPDLSGVAGDTNTYVGYADHASLSGKYTAFEYLNLTPSLNGSQIWSAGARTGDPVHPYRSAFDPSAREYGEYFAAWNMALNADTHLYGTFQPENPWFGRMTALRHTITPQVSLTYAPKIDSNPAFFPNPATGGTAFQAEQRTVSFQLGNDVDLKLIDKPAKPDSAAPPPKPERYTLLSANSGLSYNFAEKQRPWSDLSSNVSVYLIRNVAFTVTATHRLYDDFADSAHHNTLTAPILQSWAFAWRRGIELDGGFSTGTRLLDSYGQPTDRFNQSPWSASLNYGFNFAANRVGSSADGNAVEKFFGTSEVFNVSKTHSATGSVKLNPTQDWNMTYDTEFNFSEGRFSRHSFGFERKLHCWQMNFNWTPTGVAEGWYFVIRIIDLPDVKLESRDTHGLQGQ